MVLNEKLSIGVAMNAACHMCLSLVDLATPEQKANMHFIDYVDGDGIVYPASSALSLIVLTGKISHMKKFLEDAKEKGMLTASFIKTMTGDTFKEQLERTKTLKSEDIEYYGVAAFGLTDVMNTMTRKFSLYP